MASCKISGKKFILCSICVLAIAILSFPLLAYQSSTEMTLNVLANKTGCEIVVDHFPDGDMSQYLKIGNCEKGGRNEILLYKPAAPISSVAHNYIAKPYFRSGSIDGKLYAVCGFYWDGGANAFSRFPLVATKSFLALCMLLAGGVTGLLFVRRLRKARKRDK
jgi:hypothetical protein